MASVQGFEQNEFDIDQQEEICQGISAGIDVKTYADPELLSLQMRQIRLGLESGLDVSVYSDKQFDWFQMEEIRQGMMAGIDYMSYTNPSVPYLSMRQIRLGLEKNIDLTKFINMRSGVLEQLRLALEKKVNLVPFIKAGYDEDQLQEIGLALEDKVNIVPYLKTEFRGVAIREIAQGLKLGIDPSVYAKAEYDWMQMRELRLGLEHRVDITQYSNSLYSWEQMAVIRQGLEQGLDVSSYANLMYTHREMKTRYLDIKAKYDKAVEDAKDKIICKNLFSVIVSGSGMEAFLSIKNPRDSEVTLFDIKYFLAGEDINTGIMEDVLQQIVEQKQYDKKILVAKGIMPRQGADGYYEYFFNAAMGTTAEVKEDGSVDYSEMFHYDTVKQGQMVAFYHKAEDGIAGMSVTGEPIAARRGKELPMLSGSGFHVAQDGCIYLANTGGVVELREGTGELIISPTYVADDVSVETGNIDYDGKVIIKGNVGSGVSIIASGDIIIDGHVEGAIIHGGGNILVREGLDGAGLGFVDAEGDITGKFFESVELNAKGSMYANTFTNCQLNALGEIRTGGTGGLIGCDATALRGFSVHNVGAEDGESSYLKCGIDSALLEERQQLRLQKAKVEADLLMLKGAYTNLRDKNPPEVCLANPTYLKLENAIYTKEKEMDEIMVTRAEMEKAIDHLLDTQIEISGSCYQGSGITINDAHWSGDTVTNVVFVYMDGMITPKARA